MRWAVPAIAVCVAALLHPPSCRADGPRVALARSSRDTVYTLWEEGPAGKRNLFLSRKAPDGRLIGFPIRVSGPGPVEETEEAGPRIAAAGASGVALLWPETAAGHAVIRAALSNDEGRTFHALAIGPGRESGAAYVAGDLAAGPAGTVHLLLEERLASRSARIVFETVRDGRAGPPRVLAFGAVSEPAISSTPVGTTVAAAWISGPPGSSRVVARISTDGGRAFGPTLDAGPAGASTDSHSTFGPSIAAGGPGRVFVAWTEGRTGSSDARVARLAGGSFAVVSGFPAEAPSSNPAIVVDRTGALQIVWQEGRDPHSRIRIASLDPRGSFGVARTVGAGSGVRFPAAAATLGGAFVGWQEGEGDSAKIRTSFIARVAAPSSGRPAQEPSWPPSSLPSTPSRSREFPSKRRSGSPPETDTRPSSSGTTSSPNTSKAAGTSTKS